MSKWIDFKDRQPANGQSIKIKVFKENECLNKNCLVNNKYEEKSAVYFNDFDDLSNKYPSHTHSCFNASNKSCFVFNFAYEVGLSVCWCQWLDARDEPIQS